VSSFVHVDDAAAATVLALGDGPTGVFNVTDDDPAPLRAWLPEVAAILGAGRPLRAPRWVARLAAGPHGVHFATTLRGNRNAAFKDAYGWQPGHASWREGFAAEQAGGG
jgi:nucleoside-diphosphate-sugar epimerase